MNRRKSYSLDQWQMLSCFFLLDGVVLVPHGGSVPTSLFVRP